MEDHNSLFFGPRGLDDIVYWLIERFDSRPDVPWSSLPELRERPERAVPRPILPALPQRDIPWSVLEMILWKHLSTQRIGRFVELSRVCKHIKELVTEPNLRKVQPISELWVLKQNCEWMKDNIFALDTFDVLQKKRQNIMVFTAMFPRQRGRPRFSSTDELRVSSIQGGESGLVYLEEAGASGITCGTTRECFAFNPITKSCRQLRIHCSVRQIDRFSCGYVGWASSTGGDEMIPLLFDLQANDWNRIGYGFTTRGQIMKEKAVVNEVVYIRYKDRSPDLKDQLIIYDIRQKTFREVSTTGLPDTMVNEYLFQHEGRIYLAAVVPTIRSEKDLVLFKLEFITDSQIIWDMVSEIPLGLLKEVTGTSGERCELKFFSLDHELLLARLLFIRRTDGVRVVRDMALPKKGCPNCFPCVGVVAYDMSSGSWRKDKKGRLGPGLDVHTTIFRPSLDIQA
ncbi:unnamed protein product [Calypogeia fissa]